MQPSLAQLLLFLTCILLFQKPFLRLKRSLRLPDFLVYLSVGVCTGLVFRGMCGLGKTLGIEFPLAIPWLALLFGLCTGVFFFWLMARVRLAFSKGIPRGTVRWALLSGGLSFVVFAATGLLIPPGQRLLASLALGCIFLSVNVGPMILSELDRPVVRQHVIVLGYATGLLLDVAALFGFSLMHTVYLAGGRFLFAGPFQWHLVMLAGSLVIYGILALSSNRLRIPLSGHWTLTLMLLCSSLMLFLPISPVAVAALMGLLWLPLQKRLPPWLMRPEWKRLPELAVALAFVCTGYLLAQNSEVDRRLWLYLGYLVAALVLVTAALLIAAQGRQKDASLLALLFARGELALLLLGQARLADFISPSLFVAASVVVVLSTLLNQLLYTGPRKSVLRTRAASD